MKRIVVTGSKGGTGRSLVAVLRDAGYKVLGIDLKPPEPFGEPDYIQLDLRDATGVNDAFGGADAVVHFGSVPGDANRTTTEAFHMLTVAGFNVFQLSRIIYDDHQGRARLRQITDDESLGWDCLWSYVDARDVATACQAWLESDHQGAEVFNLAAPNVHHEAPVAQLLERQGYSGVPVGRLEGEDSTPFSTDKIRSILDWQTCYDWREILREAGA